MTRDPIGDAAFDTPLPPRSCPLMFLLPTTEEIPRLRLPSHQWAPGCKAPGFPALHRSWTSDPARSSAPCPAAAPLKIISQRVRVGLRYVEVEEIPAELQGNHLIKTVLRTIRNKVHYHKTYGHTPTAKSARQCHPSTEGDPSPNHLAPDRCQTRQTRARVVCPCGQGDQTGD
jgi:hypothetical protein